MSFVNNAKVMPVPMEVTVAEHINIGIGSILFGVSAVSLVIAWYHRRYPPIKAKNLVFMTLAVIAYFNFWIGKMHTSGFFGFTGIFSHCWAFSGLQQFLLGANLMIIVLNLRYYTLYYVLIRGRAPRGLRFYVPTIVYATTSVVCTVLACLGGEEFGLYWSKDAKNCFMSAPTKWYLYVCVTIGILHLAYLTWKLRNIRRSFNEYRETRWGVCLFVIYCLMNLSAFAVWGSSRWCKHIMVMGAAIAGNGYYWLVMGRPIYGCLFRHDACLREFVAHLKMDVSEYIASDHKNALAGLEASRRTVVPSKLDACSPVPPNWSGARSSFFDGTAPVSPSTSYSHSTKTSTVEHHHHTAISMPLNRMCEANEPNPAFGNEAWGRGIHATAPAFDTGSRSALLGTTASESPRPANPSRASRPSLPPLHFI
ncbi:hypothetical protein THASP1DRAFT_21637 [Thamnocephalis sphaerospora]|uniref:Uncharacterized protein n=1 Tax=Thamnocephalis sphaerospora TaxID=78915 RepID=A0A4P9XWG9_9FUNG|nr:hypothetical protein THASP1DRAFT_21637 [Thamnocephalis sphaerospora]|eukprot:RKP10683.1 hypothetical protein THASP1DRAFT_21637 [Thamnocephalis sphaerospora]